MSRRVGLLDHWHGGSSRKKADNRRQLATTEDKSSTSEHGGSYFYLHDLRADVNLSNSGTRWTACHCAAFQGHGRVIMKLMERKPELSLKDSRGRTSVDFASALETIWPFFAAEGCRRTPKADLIRLDIVQKVKDYDPSIPQDLAHFSRPGSAYAMRSQSLRGESNQNKSYASQMGDVLAEEDEGIQNARNQDPSFNIWRS
ncbi:uncharacterized protein LOC117291343 [Asterias rubens]|uniref:uncharacterized protein LOC117291343 n=1 Tax=Asterias rubens TaxID=7604 RepID=UPI001455BB48|nr:uncharacterized protein LOC117291343 [Asterias rubens]